MQIFEKTITVSKDDLDELNHVNNVRYVQWVQDIAKDHWLAFVSKEILDTYDWFLVSHHIQYKSQALLGDTLVLKTFVMAILCFPYSNFCVLATSKYYVIFH